MTEKTNPPRKRAPGGGRKRIDSSGGLLVSMNVRVTEAQREKFTAMQPSGSAWLRAQIDAAEVPAKPSGKG